MDKKDVDLTPGQDWTGSEVRKGEPIFRIAFIAAVAVLAAVLLAAMYAFLTIAFQGNWWALIGFAVIFASCCAFAWLDHIRNG